MSLLKQKFSAVTILLSSFLIASGCTVEGEQPVVSKPVVKAVAVKPGVKPGVKAPVPPKYVAPMY